MNKIGFIILCLLLSTSVSAQKNLNQFNQLLGNSQARALDSAVVSFQKFLSLNYPKEKSQRTQMACFLDYFVNASSTEKATWKFPAHVTEVLDSWEKSGLRSEIRLWPKEFYEPEHLQVGDEKNSSLSDTLMVFEDEEMIPVTGSDKKPEPADSSLHINRFGKYLHALDACCASDSLIKKYIEVKRNVGDIPLPNMARGLLNFGQQLDDPIIMRMVIAEFYYWLMFSYAGK